MEKTAKEVRGLVRDARGHARFVREMMSQVLKGLVELDDKKTNAELCRHIMISAGLENAIEMMDGDMLPNLDRAIEKLESETEEGGAA